MGTPRAAIIRHAAIEYLESRVPMSVSLLASRRMRRAHPVPAGGVFTFSRTGSKAEAIVVDFAVVPQTTAAAADYQTLPTSVTIPARKPSAAITIEPVSDGFAGAFETRWNWRLSDNSACNQPRPGRGGGEDRGAAPNSKAAIRSAWLPINPMPPGPFPSITGEGQFTAIHGGSTKLPLAVDHPRPGIHGTERRGHALGGSVVIPAGSRSTTIEHLTPIVTQTHRPAWTVVLDLAPGDYNVNLAKPAAAVTITDGNPTQTNPADARLVRHRRRHAALRR